MNKLQQIINYKWFPYIFAILLISIGVIQHFRIFGLDFIGIHTWRQTQTQTVILNFAYQDFSIFSPHINDISFNNGLYRMEFPLMQWLIAFFYKIFGNHIIITRLCMFAISLFSVFGIYKLTALITPNKIIRFSMPWLFFFSPIIYYYSVNPIPDNMALCFSIWSIYFWMKHLQTNTSSSFVWSAVFLALSIALKLPFIVFGAMYLSKLKTSDAVKKYDFKYLIIPFLICLPSLIWYVSVIPYWNGNGVIAGVFDNRITFLEYLDFTQFTLLSTLPELLINYATFPFFILGLVAVFKQLNLKNKVHLSFILTLALAIIYFFYEINMIAKVHDYYLFPFLPLAFMVVLKGLDYAFKMEKKYFRMLFILTFLVCPLTAYLRCNQRWNLYHPGTTKEFLFYKQTLQNKLPKEAKVIVDNDESNCINLYYLNRKGWGYTKGKLTAKLIEERISQGATHLCTDNGLEKNDDLNCYFDSLVIDIKPIKIYTLKLPKQK